MSFALLSTLTVLLGIAALAIGLWIAQRLRVQHREVEVLSTLFWQAAIEETRARVFVRRFRHWPAWLLLVAIASLLWLLLAQPTTRPLDGTQHVVLLNGSIDDANTRAADLQLAIDRASTLPTNAREIISVGNHLETLLGAGEPIDYASLRAAGEQQTSPNGLQWAIESLSSRASSTQPLVLHIVGDAAVEQKYLAALRSHVSVVRIPRDPAPATRQLTTLGVADSASGQWNTVDVSIGLSGDQAIDTSAVLVTVGDQPVSQPLEQVGESQFQLSDVAANGGILSVQINNQTLGSLTLPAREPIRIALDADVPETLRELIRLDRACQIVASGADVRIGSASDADLRLSTDDQPAFLIESDHDDPQAALTELIDELALKQIDATAIADQLGQVVDVQVTSADRRSIAIWKSLFSASFDFQESRACPIFVAQSIRWLANRPPLVPWAQQGDRLPVAAPEFDRATQTLAVTNDGRQVQTVRLSQPIISAANLAESPAAGMFARVSLTTWLGLIVSVLLASEWIMYQRGRLP
jgi:hypothetical protein